MSCSLSFIKKVDPLEYVKKKYFPIDRHLLQNKKNKEIESIFFNYIGTPRKNG